MNFFGIDATRDEYFPAFAVIGCHEFGDSFAGCHRPMCLTIMTDPDYFVVGNAKVHGNDGAVMLTLQFS